MIEPLEALLADLDAAGIAPRRPPRTNPTDADLQLEIDSRDEAALLALLAARSFKLGVPGPGPAQEAVGLDPARGQLLRLRWLLRGSPQPGRVDRRRPACGGLSIAVVGGDGAGKTTAVAGLRDWLAPAFAVRSFHLGRPPASPAASVLHRVANGLRRLGLGVPSLMSVGIDPPPSPPYRWLLAFQLLLVARDRRRAHAALRRAVGRGEIALCDRYPLAQLPLAEGARIRNLGDDPLLAWAAKREERLSQQIHPPDLLLILQVPPAVAAQRQAGDPAHLSRARAEATETLIDAAAGPGVHVIDASRSAASVLAELRGCVWRAL